MVKVALNFGPDFAKENRPMSRIDQSKAFQAYVIQSAARANQARQKLAQPQGVSDGGSFVPNANRVQAAIFAFNQGQKFELNRSGEFMKKYQQLLAGKK